MTRVRHLELTFRPKNSPEFTINPRAFAKTNPQTFIKFQVEKQVSSEPNNASLEIYNLNEEHAAAIDFKFDLFQKVFGPQVIICGGFVDEEINQMYTGVVTNALTTFEAPHYITRVSVKNILFELMRRKVKYQAPEGGLIATGILDIIKKAGGFVEAEQRQFIFEALDGATYDEDELIEGTLEEVTTIIANGLPRRIVIFWDDAGVNFTPSGRPADGRPTKYVSEETGLIGVPKATTSGINYETRLDSSYRINDPVVISSSATDRLASAAKRTVRETTADTSGIVFSGTTVVNKIIHSGDNREGEFKTSVETKFIDLITQVIGK